MALVSSIRKFLRNASVAFTSGKSFRRAAEVWKHSVTTLRQGARNLAGHLHSLPVRKGMRGGREVTLLGKLEGREFVNLMRTARSVEAFERATGTNLSFVAKQAFRSVDDVAELHFPDVAMLRRSRYLRNKRADLMSRGKLKKTQVVIDAQDLERLVLGDVQLLERTNRLAHVVSRTKKILTFGGIIAVTGTGIAYLCKVAAEHAAANTGCFVYYNENGTIRRCRVLGCSCPIGKRLDKSIQPCNETDLWSRMQLQHSACAPNTDGAPYCVHCDWNEEDPDSINYVDRSALPDNAYVNCENQDALDALHEMAAGTVDSAWNVVSTIGKSARTALGSSIKALPWIFGALGIIALLAVAGMLWRLWTQVRGSISSHHDNADSSSNVKYAYDQPLSESAK